MKLLVIAVVICLNSYAILKVQGDRETERLMKQTLKGYKIRSLAIPGNISLEISLQIKGLEYDPKSETLTVTGFERYSWRDQRLAWDTRAYGGVEVIRLPSKYIWIPDVMLYNGFENNYERSEVNAIVSSNGQIYWMPPCVFKVRCNPTESDKSMLSCPIRFRSWTYNGKEVKLFTRSDGPVFLDFEPSRKLNLIASEAKVNPISNEGVDVPILEYQVTLQIKHLERGIPSTSRRFKPRSGRNRASSGTRSDRNRA